MDLASTIKGLKFLVVDDMKTMRRIVKMCLKKAGAIDIVEATDGSEAWRELNREGPKIDLIICDWNMPNMTGIELLRKCRMNELYKDIAFMLVTAEQDTKQVKEAIAEKVDGYIIKPFNAEIFNQKISVVLKKKFSDNND